MSMSDGAVVVHSIEQLFKNKLERWGETTLMLMVQWERRTERLRSARVVTVQRVAGALLRCLPDGSSSLFVDRSLVLFWK